MSWSLDIICIDKVAYILHDEGNSRVSSGSYTLRPKRKQLRKLQLSGPSIATELATLLVCLEQSFENRATGVEETFFTN